ncbi:hypothetical protein GLE_0064 [Lysobacter enzymogenes]|uniref:Uncharacterized protein n=1 Tax=Lysobacter enzymogenes TaxID=69 RepID=A0A0S2DAF6_LYSEN|nr:hypothetical protein GLE_0064 [Lysobacter enzymogenes]
MNPSSRHCPSQPVAPAAGAARRSRERAGCAARVRTPRP